MSQTLLPFNINSWFQVLDGNRIAAKLLAENVHADTSALPEDIVKDLGQLPEKSNSLPIEDFGIWIDPIGKILFYRYIREFCCHIRSSLP